MPADNRAKSPPNRAPEAKAPADGKKEGSTAKRVFGLPPVLTADGLEHVATHKYVPGKYTPLDNLVNPFWLKLAHSLPMWLAPNMVTLLGFLPFMTSFFVVWYYVPHFSEPPPRLLCLLMAVTTFLYQTLDAVDGKQARRTNSSTPVGQLFDHGCDCLACMPIHSVAGMLLLTGPTLFSVAGLVTLQTGFFFAQWQEYHTGILRTSFGPVGVTETQLGLMVASLIGAIVGPEALQGWSTATRTVPGFSKPLTNGQVIICGWVVFVLVLVSISVAKTFKTILADKTRGAKGAVVAAKQLAPIAAINLAVFVLWDGAVVAQTPKKLCFLTGMVFFYCTAQMILFSMSKMEFPILQLETLPAYLALAVASRFLPFQLISTVMSVASVVLTAWVLLWLFRVLSELKAKLGIRTFRIKKPEEKSK